MLHPSAAPADAAVHRADRGVHPPLRRHGRALLLGLLRPPLVCLRVGGLPGVPLRGEGADLQRDVPEALDEGAVHGQH